MLRGLSEVPHVVITGGPGAGKTAVLEIARRVERFTFERVYGGWWGRVVVDDGAAAIRRSADRYVARLNGDRPSPQAGRSR